MPNTIVLRATATTEQKNSSSITVALPTYQAGDYVLIHLSRLTGDGIGSLAATGWTKLDELYDGSGVASGYKLAVYGRVMTGSEGLSVTFTGSINTSTIVAVASSWSEVDPTTPVDVHAIATGHTGTSAVAPSVTTTQATDMLVCGYTATTGGVSGMTLAAEWTTDAGDAVFYQQLVAAGATGTRTMSGTAGSWVASTVALNPKPNTTPTAPTLTGPANNATVNRDVTQRFTWTFSDPDAGDSQSAFDLRYSSDGGSTWATISGTTPNSYVDVAAGTFTGTSYQWQVRTYDSLRAVGPYSSSSFFTAASTPGVPTITAPTSGSTIAATPASVAWSTGSQQAYQVRRVADNAGTADPTTVYYDTGQVTDSITRSVAVPFETNGRFEHVQVRVQSSGLWSSWADVRVEVSYSPPPAPTVTLTTYSASIAVTWVNPAPSGGQVATSYNDVYRSEDGGATSIRVATAQPTNSTWPDETVASGVDYAYRVVAVAASGVQAASAWTTDAIDGGTPTAEPAILDGGAP